MDPNKVTAGLGAIVVAVAIAPLAADYLGSMLVGHVLPVLLLGGIGVGLVRAGLTS